MKWFHPQPHIIKYAYMGQIYYLAKAKDNPMPIKSYMYTKSHSILMLNVLDDTREGGLYGYDNQLEVASLRVKLTDNRVFLKKLHVHRDYRQEGLARQMMNTLIRWCQITHRDSLELYPAAPSDPLKALEEHRMNLEQLREFYQSFGLTIEKGKNLWNNTENLVERHYLDF